VRAHAQVKFDQDDTMHILTVAAVRKGIQNYNSKNLPEDKQACVSGGGSRGSAAKVAVARSKAVSSSAIRGLVCVASYKHATRRRRNALSACVL